MLNGYAYLTWATFQTEARIQIAEEQRQAEERAIRYRAMRQQVQDFWRHRFGELDAVRIEKPEFKALGLANRLRVVLADTDPSIIEAIIEIGLPGAFSNSVALEIQHIAWHTRQ